VNPKLAVRGVMNLQWRDFTRNPQFPGLAAVNGGFTSTYYILSTGADWTPRSNLFNQFNFGLQSNHEEFNPGNTLDVFGGQRLVPFPLSLTTVYPTNDDMPQPRNNPVYNVIDTVTLLKARHTYTFGGSFRRTTMWQTANQVSSAGPRFNLGINNADPASSLFNATTIPGLRSSDLANAQALYALLTGRLTSITGTNYPDETSHEYRAGAQTIREAQNVAGIFAQDQWRLTPRFTLNYGLRWEFTGAAYNTNDLFTSPTIADLYGPSKELFQPGTLDGVLDPQIAWAPDGNTLFVSSIPDDADMTQAEVAGKVLPRKTARYDATAKKEKAIEMVKAISELARDGVNVFRRFAFMKGLSEVEQVSFDRMVDPADEHRLHDSDWATHRVAWAMKLAIVGGVDKARSSAAASSRTSPVS